MYFFCRIDKYTDVMSHTTIYFNTATCFGVCMGLSLGCKIKAFKKGK